MNIRMYRYLLILLTTVPLFSCEDLLPSPPEDNEQLDGPLKNLTNEERAQFLLGDVAFTDEVFSSDIGLGPYFVATSCGSCHIGDGKGHPFTTLTRFGQSDISGNAFQGNGGPQLQNRAIPGHQPEWLPIGAVFADFTPPAVTGLGFLAALTDAQILANADPSDLNMDGISGVPNYIDPPEYFVPQAIHQANGDKYIGRFGKKAAAITLLIQTVNAYKEDMGITSDFELEEPSIYERPAASDGAPDPEVSAATVRNVVFYLRTLKAPERRNPTNDQVLAGEALFSSIGCGNCHIPQWTTPVSDIAALSEKTFYPYTDLLLHDMGTGLNDGYTEGEALPEEWRTPPLWGLGLSKTTQGGSYFLMHDGRARSISEAILLHGGEGQTSRDSYNNLNEVEKKALIKFLESL